MRRTHTQTAYQKARDYRRRMVLIGRWMLRRTHNQTACQKARDSYGACRSLDRKDPQPNRMPENSRLSSSCGSYCVGSSIRDGVVS